jgi:polyferredoxin
MNNIIGLKNLRHLVQLAMALFLLFVGWQFYQFVQHVQSGGELPYVAKPSAVEGFLPISALLGLKQWLVTGIYDPIHPAGLSIFLTILVMAVLFKKGFCSWFCPIGTLSEMMARVGKKLMGRNFQPPKWLDYILMSLKYLLLAFFVKVILIDMAMVDIKEFLSSPYNMVADIKMLYFFLDISKTAMIVIMLLMVLSLFIKMFWCRYLCPYGALQGIISLFSVFKIRRNQQLCTNCGSCNRSCPAMIKVSEEQVVSSPECTGCLNCVVSCPVNGCLNFSAVKINCHLKPEVYAVAFVASFFVMIAIAKLTGHWESLLDINTIYTLAPYIDQFAHP